MKKILLSIFLSTIFMANVVAMAGTCDDYNIETRNDNGVEVYSVLENDECNRDEAMAEILRLTGDPSYTQQPSLFRASDPLYKNNQGYHGTTTAYGWKRLYNYNDSAQKTPAVRKNVRGMNAPITNNATIIQTGFSSGIVGFSWPDVLQNAVIRCIALLFQEKHFR